MCVYIQIPVLIKISIDTLIEDDENCSFNYYPNVTPSGTRTRFLRFTLHGVPLIDCITALVQIDFSRIHRVPGHVSPHGYCRPVARLCTNVCGARLSSMRYSVRQTSRVIMTYRERTGGSEVVGSSRV